MSEAKEYRISNLSVDKNGWMHVVLSRGDDSVIDDAYIKLVEYSALAAKDAEIEQLKKRISWLESGSIHTCHAECTRLMCVQRREITELTRKLDVAISGLKHAISANVSLAAQINSLKWQIVDKGEHPNALQVRAEKENQELINKSREALKELGGE